MRICALQEAGALPSCWVTSTSASTTNDRCVAKILQTAQRFRVLFPACCGFDGVIELVNLSVRRLC